MGVIREFPLAVSTLFSVNSREKLNKSSKIWIYDMTWRQLVTGEEAKLLQKSTTAVEKKKLVGVGGRYAAG